MAKITTIIDIGSNSMRMVVFKKTSRFGFHLINESKVKVKISQGCYENNGYLQQDALNRAFLTLKSFLNISKSLKSRKIFCVATSALRDAPNKKEFIKKVSKELGVNIKVISGNQEAYYGAIAGLNLLPLDSFVSFDIGGGSCEFALVSNSKVIDTISLDIGTVRLDELYFKHNKTDEAKQYIISNFAQYQDFFDKCKEISSHMVALGGTSRAVARAIIHKEQYPLDILHGFEFDAFENISLYDQILKASTKKELKALAIRKDRYDTIKTGVFIFKTIVEYLKPNKITTSGVGVREGVYLCDILRSQNHKFPANFNPSIRSLLDRFVDDTRQSSYFGNNARKLFDILQSLHQLDISYRSIVVIASKLILVGDALDFYKNKQNTFMFILNGLHYGFTHQDKLLISIISKYTGKSLPTKDDIKQYKSLLPNIKIVQWLNFILTLNTILNSEFNRVKYSYTLENNILKIGSLSDDIGYITKQELSKLQFPIDNFALEFEL